MMHLEGYLQKCIEKSMHKKIFLLLGSVTLRLRLRFTTPNSRNPKQLNNETIILLLKCTKKGELTTVTRVREIKEEQDKGWLTKSLGFPRPVKAELNFEGVGAYREAKFTNGLIFHETVSEYVNKTKMVFSIKAYPHEIPSTTMDKHVVIGGQYFDVLNGTYELEKLNDKTYRLHLYSHFKLTTTFNFYASWWAKWIMKDIQNNILEVVKQRAEGARE